MKRKLIAAALAASLVTALAPMDAHALAPKIIHKKIFFKKFHKAPKKLHFAGHGKTGAWVVGGIVCAALGPILTTLIVNRHLTRDEAVTSMFFCFPPGLYGVILKNQGQNIL